jgi:hypothetical protein
VRLLQEESLAETRDARNKDIPMMKTTVNSMLLFSSNFFQVEFFTTRKTHKKTKTKISTVSVSRYKNKIISITKQQGFHQTKRTEKE